MKRALASLALASTVFGASIEARADGAGEGRRELWQYRPLQPADYAITGLLGASALYFGLVLDPPGDPAWTGPILFDDDVRDALLATSREGRSTATTTSDALVAAQWLWVASDAWLAAGLSHHPDYELAWHLTVIDLQTIALAGAVTEVAKAIAVRERPDTEPCAADPAYGPRCGVDTTESFPSGHSSAAATAAALVCVHHAKLELYGSPALDAGACVGSSALALTAGAMRVVADRHYATDVIAGYLLGGGIGVSWPLLFHYRRPEPAGATALRWALAPSVTRSSQGVLVSGWF